MKALRNLITAVKSQGRLRMHAKNDGGFLMVPFHRKGRLCWVDVHPVRQKDFIEFVRADGGGYYCEYFWEPGEGRDFLRRQKGNELLDRLCFDRKGYGSHHPVTNINWHEAVAFARWRQARLPELDEWIRWMAAGLFDLSRVRRGFFHQIRAGYPAVDNHYGTRFTAIGTCHAIGGEGYLEWTHGAETVRLSNPVNGRAPEVNWQRRFPGACCNNITFRCVKERW